MVGTVGFALPGLVLRPFALERAGYKITTISTTLGISLGPRVSKHYLCSPFAMSTIRTLLKPPGSARATKT